MTQSVGSTWEWHKRKDHNSGRQGLTPVSFTIQCQLTALKRWYAFQGDKMLYQRIPTPRPAPKEVLKDAWQVEPGKLSSSERSLANAVLEDQGRMTKNQEMVDKLSTEYRTESVIADFSKTGEFNRFSEESKKRLQKIGKIDLFELGKVTKIKQCLACAECRQKDWLL